MQLSCKDALSWREADPLRRQVRLKKGRQTQKEYLDFTKQKKGNESYEAALVDNIKA